MYHCAGIICECACMCSYDLVYLHDRWVWRCYQWFGWRRRLQQPTLETTSNSNWREWRKKWGIMHYYHSTTFLTCTFTYVHSLIPLSLPPSLSPSHLGHLCWICPVWSHKPLPCGTCIWCTDCYPGTQVHHLCWLQCCSPYPLGCGRGPDHGNSPPIFLQVGSSLPCSIHSSLSLCIATDSIDWQKNWQEDHTETKVHMHEQSINHVSLKKCPYPPMMKAFIFQVCKTRSSGDSTVANSRNHLPWDFPSISSDGTLHPPRWRYFCVCVCICIYICAVQEGEHM